MELEDILREDIPLKEQQMNEGFGQTIGNAAGNLISQAGNSMLSMGTVGQNISKGIAGIGQGITNAIGNKVAAGKAKKVADALQKSINALKAYGTYLEGQITNASKNTPEDASKDADKSKDNTSEDLNSKTTVKDTPSQESSNTGTEAANTGAAEGENAQ